MKLLTLFTNVGRDGYNFEGSRIRVEKTRGPRGGGRDYDDRPRGRVNRRTDYQVGGVVVVVEVVVVVMM